jgi:hypothetical protein
VRRFIRRVNIELGIWLFGYVGARFDPGKPGPYPIAPAAANVISWPGVPRRCVVKVLVSAAAAALFLSCLPVYALQTVTLPPDKDGYTPFQDPDAQSPDLLPTDKQDQAKHDGLGSFHFSVTQNPGWPNDPGYYYRPGSSSPAGYGTSNVPGSEFYTSGYPYPH